MMVVRRELTGDKYIRERNSRGKQQFTSSHLDIL